MKSLFPIFGQLYYKLKMRRKLSKLRQKHFSIIGNNCIAGRIYRKLELPYLTPTIGLFFFSNDYIKFLENFEHYIKQPLKFVETSKHHEAIEYCKKKKYPIGVIEDVEIHFLHYDNAKEASEKWERRANRINFDNLFFIYSDKDGFQEEFLSRYEKLPFKRKIFLSSKPRGDSRIVVFVKDYEGKLEVGESEENQYEKYVDIVKWLSGDTNFMKSRT